MAELFKVALGSPMAMPSSSTMSRLVSRNFCSSSNGSLPGDVIDGDVLGNESPEEKLEHRFLIFRHFLANVPLPLAKRGVGAMPEKYQKKIQD